MDGDGVGNAVGVMFEGVMLRLKTAIPLFIG
jgi:hypothetical protein